MEQIYGAIAGRPKKEVIAMIEWLHRKEAEHESDPNREEEYGPFDAATVLKNWRAAQDEKRRRKELAEQGKLR